MNNVNARSHPILVKVRAGYHQHTARGRHCQAQRRALLPVITIFMQIFVNICLPGKLVYSGGKSYKKQFNPNYTETNTALLSHIYNI